MIGHLFAFVLCASFGNCFADSMQEVRNAEHDASSDTKFTVVFLYGSAGNDECRPEGRKRLVDVIAQKNGWRLVSEDDACYENAPVHWKNSFSQEFVAIEKAFAPGSAFHAVVRNQPYFNAGLSDKDRLEAFEAILSVQNYFDDQSNNQERKKWHAELRSEIAHDIMEMAKKNHVVVDSWHYLKDEHLQQISKTSDILYVAVYCPFEKLVNQAIKRNAHAVVYDEISAVRFYHQTITGFFAEYELSVNPEGAIEKVTKESVDRACNRVRFLLSSSPTGSGAEHLFTRGEFSIVDFDKYQKSLLEQFGDADFLYVHPKFKADMVVRTDEMSLAECAQEIRARVEREKN